MDPLQATNFCCSEQKKETRDCLSETTISLRFGPFPVFQVSGQLVHSDMIGPLPALTVTIHLTRQPVYYILNVVVPSLLISFLSYFVFLLPVNSGEKISLQVMGSSACKNKKPNFGVDALRARPTNLRHSAGFFRNISVFPEMSVALKSQKMPNCKREMAKRLCTLQMCDSNMPSGQNKSH